MSEKFDVEYDLVVVGGGGSGLSCAVQAAQNGLTVAVLEKMPQLGGSSAFAEGHAAFESDEQIKRGIDVSKDEAFRAYMDYSHWRADAAIVSKFVENAATTIVKMRELGAV
ncbi:MAG: FAD-dependent oxidoreductase, partial [Actinobacteria bacterium]|nr:FAD-dependent oxidoreductase [Actinomycetota bacterium]